MEVTGDKDGVLASKMDSVPVCSDEEVDGW